MTAKSWLREIRCGQLTPMCAVENKLSVSSMEFSTFADEADSDGVLRSFKDP